MQTFWLARQGETINNRDKRLSGWIDTPLTESGLEPTKAVITKLQSADFNTIYSSDLGRAYITASVIARGLLYSDEIIRVSELREVNYGDAANMRSAEAYQLFPRLDRDTHYTPPHGESLHDMQQRVLSAVHGLQGPALIVAHSGVMAALKSSYTGEDFGAHNISEAYPHDYVANITMQDGVVTSFNEA